MDTLQTLMSAEEFAQFPDDGIVRELVKGKVVEMNLPKQRHGEVTFNIGGILRQFVRQRNLGRVSGNDSGVITSRAPDSVRGADVSFFSYNRVPHGPLDDVYAAIAPELVFEVLSSTDRIGAVLDKAAQWFQAGVIVVCLADPESESVTVLRADSAPLVLHSDDAFELPELLGDFRVPVSEFFA